MAEISTVLLLLLDENDPRRVEAVVWVMTSVGWMLNVLVNIICAGSLRRWIFVVEPLYASGVVPNMSLEMMEGI